MATLLTKANQFNQVDYQYNIYKEYLDSIRRNINFAINPELSIKYYHINLDKSTNINTEYPNIDELPDERRDEMLTSMLHKYENSTYDIYEFFPVLEMQPLVYDENDFQTQGNFSSIFFNFKPLPGDLFTYYGGIDGTTDKYELFQITSVSYQRTTKHILPIYNIMFRSAPLTIDQVKEFNINKVKFFNNEINCFLDSSVFYNHKKLKDSLKNNTLSKIQEIYSKDFSNYNLKFSCDLTSLENNYNIFPVVLNNNLNRINQLNILPIQPSLFDFKLFSLNISLQDYINNQITIDSSTKDSYLFNIYTKEDLYNFLKSIEKPDKFPYELTYDNQGNVVFIDNDTLSNNPIAFIDKDLYSGNTFIILEDSKYFDIYYDIYKYILDIQNIIYNIESGEILEENSPCLIKRNQFLEIFTNYNKIEGQRTKGIFINFNNITKKCDLKKSDTMYINQDLNFEIIDTTRIGDFNLPTSISFQGGVQW